MSKEEIIIRIRTEVEKAKHDLKTVKRLIKENNIDNAQGDRLVAEQQQKATKHQNKLKNATGASTQAFKGWALSIMFAGMALNRMFGMIRKFGLKAFEEITHSIDGMVTKSDMMQGSMKYLGFVIGDALQPIIGFLIPIVDMIADWIEQNPNLTAGIIALGTAVGIFLSTMGMIVLANAGLSQFFEILTLGKVTSLTTALKGLGTSLKGLFSGMGVKGAAGAGLAKFGIFAGLIAGIIAALVWIYKLQEVMGGWKEFFKSVLRGVLRVFAVFGAGLAGSWAAIWNTLKKGFNLFLDFMEKRLNTLIGYLQNMIDAYNALGGNINIKLPKVDFSSAKSLTYNTAGDAFADVYAKKMQAYEAFEIEHLAPEKGYATGGGILPEFADKGQTVNIEKVEVTGDKSFQELLDELNRDSGMSVGVNL